MTRKFDRLGEDIELPKGSVPVKFEHRFRVVNRQLRRVWIRYRWLNKGTAERSILDLDQHWGNGTEDIIRRLSIRWVQHHTSGNRHLGPNDAEPHLADLATLVNTFKDCAVLLYQAGADAHVDDPLGGWMTSEQLAQRDRIVFSTAARIGLPVAWNLAGGYQTDASGGIAPVLAIHRKTMRACVDTFAES